jgi:hypothetical protein
MGSVLRRVYVKYTSWSVQTAKSQTGLEAVTDDLSMSYGIPGSRSDDCLDFCLYLS